MELLDQIFGHAGHVSWLQECARAALIFCYGLLAVRLFGRRIFGRWAALDIVVSIVIGSNLSRALTGNADLWGTLFATSFLFAVHWVLAHGAARSEYLSRILEGTPLELARDGRTDARHMHRAAVTKTDLFEALHQAGLEDTEGVRMILLEPSGKISVFKRPAASVPDRH